MPLMTSPIDGSPMRQINRFGIEIDVCPTSGGIWLDKGELEKLMQFIKDDAAREQMNYAPDNGRRGSENYRQDHREESGFSRFMEIFDF